MRVFTFCKQVLLCGMVFLSLSGRVTAQLSLGLEVNRGRQVVWYGEPVVVVLILRNNGPTTVTTYGMKMGTVGYYPRITWTGPDGTNREFVSDCVTNPSIIQLPPGQEYQKTFDIGVTADATRPWSFDAPGVYTIRASYESVSSGSLLVSNPATMRMVDRGDKVRSLIDEYRTTDLAILILSSNQGPGFWSEGVVAHLNKMLATRDLAYLRAPNLHYLALALMAKRESLAKKGADRLQLMSLDRVALQHLRDVIDQYEMFSNIESAYFHAGKLSEALQDRSALDHVLSKARSHYKRGRRSRFNAWVRPYISQARQP